MFDSYLRLVATFGVRMSGLGAEAQYWLSCRRCINRTALHENRKYTFERTQSSCSSSRLMVAIFGVRMSGLSAEAQYWLSHRSTLRTCVCANLWGPLANKLWLFFAVHHRRQTHQLCRCSRNYIIVAE